MRIEREVIEREDFLKNLPSENSSLIRDCVLYKIADMILSMTRCCDRCNVEAINLERIIMLELFDFVNYLSSNDAKITDQISDSFSHMRSSINLYSWIFLDEIWITTKF